MKAKTPKRPPRPDPEARLANVDGKQLVVVNTEVHGYAGHWHISRGGMSALDGASLTMTLTPDDAYKLAEALLEVLG